LEEIVYGSQVISRNTDGLLEELPRLRKDISDFRTVGARISEAHRRNKQTLGHHTQLLELLEIPQLMDTCVRNGLYTEALELRSFASTLLMHHQAIQSGMQRVNSNVAKEKENKVQQEEAGVHRDSLVGMPVPGSGIKIIQSIVDEVDGYAESMRRQLLAQLKTKINLLNSLRIISSLRRLDAQTNARIQQERKGGSNVNLSQMHDMTSESRLRHDFLECRDAYVSSLSQDIQRGRPYQNLINIIKRNRENWFDIITQYRTIFAPGSVSGESKSKGTIAFLDDEGILSRWVCSKIDAFVDQLEYYLPRIDDCGSIANILEQAMYFGASLARVGADFRPLLVPIFVERICNLTDEYWHNAFKQAQSSIESGEWGIPLPVPKVENNLFRTAKEKEKAKSEQQQQDELDLGSREERKDVEDLTPPIDFLSFPVVSALVNGILMSFNELRSCASPFIGIRLGNELEKYLLEIPRSLRAYREGRPEEVLRETQERFDELCLLLSRVFLPYVQKCFDNVFGMQHDQNVYGMPSNSRLSTYLNIKQTQEQIDILLPLQQQQQQHQQPPIEDKQDLNLNEDTGIVNDVEMIVDNNDDTKSNDTNPNQNGDFSADE